ncbi:MAG: leucyl aminopeptidase family protein [Mycobacteriales bacterium]
MIEIVVDGTPGSLDGAGAVAVPVDADGEVRAGAYADALPASPAELTAGLAVLRRGEPVAAGQAYSLPAGGRLVHLIGTGDGSPADLRRAGAGLARTAAADDEVAAVLPAARGGAVQAFVEGLALASYRYSFTPDDGARRPAVRLAAGGDTAGVTAGLTLAGAVEFARDLVNTPANRKNPAWLAERASAEAAARGVEARIRDEEWLAAHGCGGILAVGAGSVSPPRLIELAYRPEGARAHVVLVGKGITFDTGGISLKPASGLILMKKDMAGAATVLATVLGAAELALPVAVTALAPAAENAVSGSAYRNGDVIRHYGGRTTEVTNTDAEGRLVLADALAYAADRLDPDYLVDYATLTGAARVALGRRTAALFATDDRLADRLLAAASRAGEGLWRLPLVEDYRRDLRSPVADADHSPHPAIAGSIIGALFLEPFAGGRPWAHVDFSAPSWAEEDEVELVRGATGYGVRTLLTWISTL